jgi:hypothetical protein
MSNSTDQATNRPVVLTRQALKTPRAPASAGIAFAVLFTTSDILIRLAVPENPTELGPAAWLQNNTASLSLATTPSQYPASCGLPIGYTLFTPFRRWRLARGWSMMSTQN